MNFVKWLRKNNTKIMAIVVVALMFLFIGGEYIQQFGRRRLHGQTVAYFLDNKKITTSDRAAAQRELDILRMLRADDLLRSYDLGAIFLSELLFSERRTSPLFTNQIRQVIRTGDYRVSDKQINDIYSRSVTSDLYWVLLEYEARQAGVKIPKEDVGEFLGEKIPQLFNGQSYSQFIGLLVQRQGIAEEQILDTFGKLLAILQYAQNICSGEIVTTSQIMHQARWENEAIDAEFVKFDARLFSKDQNQPSEEKMLQHFNRYKKFFRGDIAEDNAYGFGYKLPDRVQLEYMVLKLDDVASTVTAPTQEETEEFYLKNREQLFTEEVPTDPNDPNSPVVKQTKSYSEVMNIISKQLLQDKVNSKAERILGEARTITEVNWKDTDSQKATFTTEQLRQAAGDYQPAANQLAEKYKIKVYTGQTGLLSAADIQTDKYLVTLCLQPGAGYNPVRLTQIVFSVDESTARAARQTEGGSQPSFDVPRPKLYENIGPVTDIYGLMLREFSGRITALVRVTKVVRACEPENIDETFNTKPLELDNEPNKSDPNAARPKTKDTYCVREEVTEDLKNLAAMDIAKSKAEEFLGLVSKDSWDSALNKFNELYRQQTKQDESEPNAFRLENIVNLRRLSGEALQTLAVQNSGNPAVRILINDNKKQAQRASELYSLVPPDSNTPSKLPVIMEFKPETSFYCLKTVLVNRLYQEDFDRLKARRLFREDHIQAQSLTAVHFNPENILKRMNFRPAREDEEEKDQTEANEPAKSTSPADS